MKTGAIGMAVLALAGAALPAVAHAGQLVTPGTNRSGTSDSRLPNGANVDTSPTGAATVDQRSADDVAIRQGERPRRSRRAVPAKPADVVAGRQIDDPKGALIGTVESVDASGAVVAADKGRVSVPLESFGINGDRLVLGMAKADFDKLVSGATAAPAP